MEMKIKICGMRETGNIKEIAALNPDFMGFIFYERSPRYVGDMDMTVTKTLLPHICPVGVFVNETTNKIIDLCVGYGINTVQLHGNESATQCAMLKQSGFSVFKAVGVNNETKWDSLTEYSDNVDAFVFDTATTTHGGCGIKWNWRLLDKYALKTPFLLSGGITPDDISNLLAIKHPALMGVDINSRFETRPGVKDILKTSAFITSLRKI